MMYDCILIGSGPVNLIEAMFLSKQGKKVLVLEQSEHIGGAWGKVPLKKGWPDFQLGCHIWDIEPKALNFLSEFLDMDLAKMKPQPEFVFKGIKLPYDWKNLLFYIRGMLRPKGEMESVSFNKARIIPATPTSNEVITNPKILNLLLFIPDRLEAKGLLPIAVKYLPYLV